MLPYIITPLFAIAFSLFMLLSFPFAIAVWFFRLVGLRGLSRFLSNIIPHIWGRYCIYLTASSVHIDGKENIPKSGGVVYYCNHSSFMDIPLLLGFVDRKARFVARESLLQAPILGSWLTAMEYGMITRKGSRKELSRVEGIIGRIQNGERYFIFPEGTRTPTGELGRFRAGAARYAQKSETPAVPIAITGTYQLLPKGAFRITPSKLTIHIGNPIPADELVSLSPTELMEQVKRYIEKAAPRLGHTTDE